MGRSEGKQGAGCTRGRPRGLTARFVQLTLIAGSLCALAAAPAQAAPFAYVTNAGGADVSQYDVATGGTLTALSPPTVGAGGTPIVAAASPDGTSVYVTNETSNDISQYDVGTGGTLTPKTPPTVAAGSLPVGLVVSPDGASVYVANIGDGTVSQYDVGTGGTLAPKSPPTVAAGNGPELLAISPDGSSLYVANTSDNTISQYDVGTGGALAPKTPATVATGSVPIGLRVSPDGASVYVANSNDNTVSQYDVGTGGTLTPKIPPVVATGVTPVDVVLTPDGTSAYVTNFGSDDVSQYDVGTGGALIPKLPPVAAAGDGPQLAAVSSEGASVYVATASDGSVSQYDVGTGGVLAAKSPATVAAGAGPTSVALTSAVAELSIDDVTQNEGDSGTTTYTFTVSRTGDTSGTSDVQFATEDGSATDADNDYEPTSGSLSFAAGETSKTIDVTVNGDTKFEPNEDFTLKLSNPVNATISDDTGLGTITNDDSQPTIFISDAADDEGNSGTTAYTFTISLSNPSTEQVTVTAASQDGTATLADSDYQQLPPTTVIFVPGDTSEQVTVDVNGDTKYETDETFGVNLSNPVNATIGNTPAVATIWNDDSSPTVTIDDVTHNEGNAGTTAYTFTISLSNASFQQVDVTAASQDGSATLADNDYQQLSSTLVTFAPNDTSEQVTVNVNGDTAFEPTETFNVKLSGAVNATIADDTGVGTITNDDSSPIQTQSFQAQADARVEEERSSSNFGSSTFLRVDNDDEVWSYLRFNLSGISGTIKSAKLKLFATEGTSNGPAAYKTNWTGSESSLTWNNKTSATSGATDDKGSIPSNSFVEYDVKSLVTGNGLQSFILKTSSSDGVDFASRESSTFSRRPQLIITYGTDTQDPDPPTGLQATVPSSTQVQLSWNAATDDFGVTNYKIYRNSILRAMIGNQTSYTDSVTAGNTYSYYVTALDAAGNESGPSNTVTVTVPFSFTAVADARVEQANSSSNFGTSTLLRVDAGSDPDIETFLRFQLSGLTTVSSAKLRLWVTNGTTNGPAAYKTNWTGSETNLRWSNRTPRTHGPVDDKGSISSNTFVDFNVTSLPIANGANSYILAGTSTDAIDFSSRETSTSSRRPQLLVTP